jgi:hypothetical protein
VIDSFPRPMPFELSRLANKHVDNSIETSVRADDAAWRGAAWRDTVAGRRDETGRPRTRSNWRRAARADRIHLFAKAINPGTRLCVGSDSN